MKPGRQLFIAVPHGFCAGVKRAVAAVETALAKRRPEKLYVFNEIVHNNSVVNDFRSRGVEFVHDATAAPPGATVIFSAHGVSGEVERQARERGLRIIDATCPLVTALHNLARRRASDGRPVILIGSRNHPEVIGTLGRMPEDSQRFAVETAAEAARLPDVNGVPVVLTQTTLNNRDLAPILEALKQRFGRIEPANSHCYATENRQNAVMMLAEKCELILIIGSAHSSNSRQLCKVAEAAGCPAKLIDHPSEIVPAWLADVRKLGVSAGASAPPELFDDTLKLLSQYGFSEPCAVTAADEKAVFPPPESL